jgi:hypothetical protein
MKKSKIVEFVDQSVTNWSDYEIAADCCFFRHAIANIALVKLWIFHEAAMRKAGFSIYKDSDHVYHVCDWRRTDKASVFEFDIQEAQKIFQQSNL